jgi:hypothetical protein
VGLGEAPDLAQDLLVFRRPAQEPAVPGRLGDVQLGRHAGPAQGPVQEHGVGQQQVAGAGGEDGRREALAKSPFNGERYG